MTIGEVLKKIRESKGLDRSEVIGDFLGTSSLSRIESGKQVPATDNFFGILSYLNVDVHEFCYLISGSDICYRTVLDSQIRKAFRLRDMDEMKRLKKEVEELYEVSGMPYFLHAKILLTAQILYKKNGFDAEKTRAILGEENIGIIRDYLKKIDEWYFYEVRLAGNLLFLFDMGEALKLSEKAIASIDKNYLRFKEEEITEGILINLTLRILEESDDKEHLLTARSYVTRVSGLPKSTRVLSSRVHAKILEEVINFKLDNGQFNKNHLVHLINWFALVDMGEVNQELRVLIKKHGIVVKNFAKVCPCDNARELERLKADLELEK